MSRRKPTSPIHVASAHIALGLPPALCPDVVSEPPVCAEGTVSVAHSGLCVLSSAAGLGGSGDVLYPEARSAELGMGVVG